MAPSVSYAQWPNVLEAKAIAEEGFIYGLRIVMNYAVTYVRRRPQFGAVR
jgi:hypothetical protein